MNNILALREKRANLWDAAKKFRDAHLGEDGMMSAEDATQYDRMVADIDRYAGEIARLEKQEAIENELTGKPIFNQPASEEKHGRSSDEYRKACVNAIRTGFRKVSDVMTEGTDANGGYLVPEEWDSRIIDKLNEENVIRAHATVITTTGEHKINVAANKPAAAWVDEGESITFGDSAPTFGQVVLDAHKLAVAVKASEELIYDSAFDIESFLLNAFTTAIANGEENAFINGTEGGIKGLLTDTYGAQTALTSAKAAEITADELISLVYGVARPYRKNAFWLMKDSTIATVRKLKDGNGTYLWQPSMQMGEPDRIAGFPVLTSQYMPELTAGNKAIAFGDMSYFNVGDRGTRSFRRLNELFAGNGLVGFMMTERVDGVLTLTEAVKVIKQHA